MKPALKKPLLILVGVAVLAGIAAPKLLPLMHEGKPGKTASAETAGAKAPSADGGKKKKEGGASATSTPMKVNAVRVDPAPFTETLIATGTLIAEEGVELQAETSGKVMAINFTEGSRVKKGDLLIKLNDAELRASLVRARYQLTLAQTRERRFAPLIEQGLVTREEYDIALSELNVQKSEIALTEAQIQKTEIRAPFDGEVGLRYVSEGAFVNAATRVATLQKLDNLKIDFSVPEKYATRIRVGSPVHFTVAGGQSRFTGRIYAFDPRIDAGTRSVSIRATTDNAEHRLLPGAFANVELVLDQIDNALLVPAVAVIPGLNEKNVFVMKDGKAEMRAVETGTRTTTSVQILSGLKPGDIVITSGLQNMRAGQAVAVDNVSLPAEPTESARKPRGAGVSGPTARGVPAP